MIDRWNAFVTIHWFLTGVFCLWDSESRLSKELYLWFLRVDLDAENRGENE